MPDPQMFSCFASVLVISYLSGALLIAKRLEKSFPAVWDRIGRPSLSNWGIANSSRLGRAVLFGTSLRQLNDPRLSALVWMERILAAMILAALSVWVTHYHGGHSSI